MGTQRLTALSAAVAFSVLAASCATTEPPPPPDMMFELLADKLQAGTVHCQPAFDGIKSKGELTNADLGRIVRRMPQLPAAYPELKLTREGITEIMTAMATSQVDLCRDRRFMAVTEETISPRVREASGNGTSFGAVWLTAETISLPTTVPDPQKPELSAALALLNSGRGYIVNVQTVSALHQNFVIANAVGNSQQAAQMRQAILPLLNNPLLLFPSLKSTDNVVSTYSKAISALFQDPPLKPELMMVVPATPAQPQPARQLKPGLLEARSRPAGPMLRQGG